MATQGEGSADSNGQAPYSGPAPKNSKIFVGGLSWDTTDVSFTQFFSKYGEIKDSVVMKDREGGSRGFGFITFSLPESAGRVLKDKANLELDGRKIEVKLAVPRETMGRGGSINRTKKIFCGGLGELTEDQLRAHFSSYGTVTDCMIMKDKENGRSRGFGFVTFESEDTVAAVCGQEHNLLGKVVECKPAVPKVRTGGPGGPGGPGGYGPPRGYGRGGYGGYEEWGYGPPRGGGYGPGYGGYGAPPRGGYEDYYGPRGGYDYGAAGADGYGNSQYAQGGYAAGGYGAAAASSQYAGYQDYRASATPAAATPYAGAGPAPAARGSRSYHPYRK
eukprot:gb/GEZN01009337.1/.p1 GENE.gb/GEZN01009337.1/~~gb/GEZN01009337.1/.p1  ORF type:complete len:332 (-),score=23.15 gb/GEZN01009337.1/:209-1204(-)